MGDGDLSVVLSFRRCWLYVWVVCGDGEFQVVDWQRQTEGQERRSVDAVSALELMQVLGTGAVSVRRAEQFGTAC